METVDNKWRSWRAADFYKELEKLSVKSEEWEQCPNCDEKPRLWIFDNGEYAKCKCQGAYDEAAAKGISIWEYHKKHNGDMTNWNHDDLRDNWNAFVEKQKSENCK